jgi:hypothetical protein
VPCIQEHYGQYLCPQLVQHHGRRLYHAKERALRSIHPGYINGDCHYDRDH